MAEKKSRFHDIDDEERLYYEPIIRTPKLIEGILPKGLTVLCGAPKTGKSWLMLWICRRIALGIDVWERKTKQTEVLYLGLEDTHERMQERVGDIVKLHPTPLLRFKYDWPNLDEGFEQDMEEFLFTYPKTGLVVIDTLQKIRNPVSGSVNLYSQDYRDMGTLKSFAEKHKMGILVVHHTRKQSDSNDPFNDVSGSTGITGAADTVLILKSEKRFSDRADLYVSGRDIEKQILKLRFKDNLWELTESVNEEEISKKQVPEFVFRVADFMDERTVWKGSATELLAEMKVTDLHPNTASRYLAQFYSEALFPHIEFFTHRTGKGRTITLLKCDASDDNDDKFSSEKASSSSTLTVTPLKE